MSTASGMNEPRADAIQAMIGELVAVSRKIGELIHLSRFEALGPERIIEFVQSDRKIKFYIPYANIDGIQAHIMNNTSFFEIALLRKVREYVAGKVVLDAGANIGNHSVFFAAIAGAAMVLAFEPMRVTYELLTRNLSLNNLVNVRPYNVALGAGPGFAALADYDSRNMGGATVAFGRGSYPVMAIDQFELERVDFIKIDVEGAQLALLDGARRTLARCRPRIWIELRAEHGEVEPGHAALLSHGYQRAAVLSPTDFLYEPI